MLGWPWETKREALARQREDFERTLVVLREENSTFRRLLEASGARADQLTLELAKSMVVQATPPPHPAQPQRTSRDAISGLGNLLEPVGYDHPEATFTDARAASLMAVEDEDDGVSHAA